MGMNGVSDYLVVGAGAMGMAFTDVLMNETETTVIIVDRHGRPGGHWNDSYPFVAAPAVFVLWCEFASVGNEPEGFGWFERRAVRTGVRY